jgi:uncharacterized protein
VTRVRLRALLALAALACPAALRAEPALPPPPAAYFNDYAGVVSAADAQRLNDTLASFAKQTSTQVVVAVFDTLPSASLEDFTVRTAESWRVGRKDWDNGAVFFVFVKDRKMRIETGYGLEGALPDALAHRILDERVVPHFRQGDWTGGLEAGIDGILEATRGEYKAPPPQHAPGLSPVTLVVLLFLAVLVLWLAGQGARHMPGGYTYSGRGPRRDRSYWGGGGWGGGGFGGFGGGGSFGGGGGSFGGGGFSGGGGSFGGGGASSSW